MIGAGAFKSFGGDENSVPSAATIVTMDLAPSTGHPAPAIARRAAPFANCAGALVWVVGLFLVEFTGGGILPSDVEYFWIGAVGSALGILLIPVALVASPKLLVQGTGLIICVAMVITGVLLILGATGILGVPAPAWIRTWSAPPFVALFVWILFASLLERRRSQLGPVVAWLAVVNGAVLLVLVGISLHPYTHTNETELVDGLLTLFLFFSLPAWLMAVAIRLWRPASPQPAAPG